MSEDKLKADQWFVASLQAHRETMFRTAMAMLRRAADAEDAVSTATINTYARLHLIRNRDSIRSYLIKATVNAAHNQLRRRKRSETIATELMADNAATVSENPLWFYLDTLSPKIRLTLQLRYGENLPLNEICRILRLPKGTVSARINRGLARLREMMEKEI
ncbi:MAG: RNA polymerase sigma factor [Christensenellales bacterium]|jgi:RNA polymerase sigma-70 factor (ECF subfamily)